MKRTARGQCRQPRRQAAHISLPDRPVSKSSLSSRPAHGRRAGCAMQCRRGWQSEFFQTFGFYLSAYSEQRLAILNRLPILNQKLFHNAGLIRLNRIEQFHRFDNTNGIIEAMKLLNEIEADEAGIVKEFLVENGQ